MLIKRMISNTKIIKLFITVGAALFLIVGVLSPLRAASGLTLNSLNADRVAEGQLLPRAQAITPTPTISLPTTILELFGLTDDIPHQENDLTVTGVDGSNPGLLSSIPLFTATEVPTGVVSMDWGDVDLDGDLDLAIGGLNGTAVYTNDSHGLLFQTWHMTSHKALEVRWAQVDADTDPQPELLAVGNSGSNYFYSDPEIGGEDSLFLSSDKPLFRIEPGDYNNDGQIDVVVSTDVLSTTCAIQLYINSDDDPIFPNHTCISDESTASLSAADFNHDGFLDLAVGSHQTKEIWILENTQDSPFLTITTKIVVASSLVQIPFDFSWGDYDSDEYLDLAAAFPQQQEVRIYRNDKGDFPNNPKPIIIPTTSDQTPLAIDWADFDNDGQVELAVADVPPKIYKIEGITPTLLTTLPIGRGRFRDIYGVDVDNDSDLDVGLANQLSPSQVFKTLSSPLRTTLTYTSPEDEKLYSVAWGDVDDDGYLDLLLGGEEKTSIYIYDKESGSFANNPEIINESGFTAAFGDMDNDPELEVVLGTGSNYKIYNHNHNTNQTEWTPIQEVFTNSQGQPQSAAWGYLESDAQLDLLLGGDMQKGLRVYKNQDTSSPFSENDPWEADDKKATYDVAWADYNQDGYLDFAVANGTSDPAVQVYLNNKNNTFSPIWGDSRGEARSVAWADYNQDGWPDLAVGYYGTANHIYENQNGGNSFTSKWNSGVNDKSRTTSLAWADYDGDGWSDLAVGNEGQPNQVYTNLGSSLNPSLTPVWRSQEVLSTTQVAWGDKDGDGDMDLAVSSLKGGGVYENNYVLPAHICASVNPCKYMQLPNTPSYLSIRRPGQTADAYFLSTGEITGTDPTTASGQISPPPVQINYTLFDPDARDDGERDVIIKTLYEYSLDGGGTWTETTNITPSIGMAKPTLSGTPDSLEWDVARDEAISDNAQFRITIFSKEAAGPVQRGATRATSPLFRVRAITCEWPHAPVILTPLPDEDLKVGEIIRFLGNAAVVDTVLKFIWDFDDGRDPVTAQLANHRYTIPGEYKVTLTVRGEPCPVTRDAVVIEEFTVTTGPTLYLPLVLKSGAATLQVSPTEKLPEQVTGLQGQVDTTAGATLLAWRPNPASDAVLGYRIYRGSRMAVPGENPFHLLNTVPTTASSYADTTATCGYMYYITAFNANGESLPSTGSYFNLICQ